MDPNFGYDPYFSGATLYNSFAVVFAAVFFFAAAIGTVLYVFEAIGLYRLAKKRGIPLYGLAWVPIFNTYILGKIADDVNFCRRNKRTKYSGILLGLTIAVTVLSLVVGIVSACLFLNGGDFYFTQDVLPGDVMLLVFLLFACGSLVSVLSIVLEVFLFIALYRIYYGYDQMKATLYEVLSILFSFMTPIFLFILRNRPLLPPDPRTFAGGVPPMGMTQPAGEGMTPPVTAENNFDPTNRKDV